MSIPSSFSSLFASRRKAGCAAAALTALILTTTTSAPSVHADPRQYQALNGFGSQVTQALGNAWTGWHNDVFYTPIHTTVATGQTQLASWDATPAGECITTKLGGPPLLRPTGSTNGVRILSRAYAGGVWGGGACGNRNVSGLVDFARSDTGPVPGTALTYIPFGREMMGWAYIKRDEDPVVDLSPAELASLHLTGPQMIRGTVVIPCGIQTGAGTYAAWMSALGTPVSGDVGTAFCNTALGAGADPTGRISENDAGQLAAKALALETAADPICDGVPGGLIVSCANAQVIVGFRVSSYVAQANGVTAGSVAGVSLGRLDATPAITGTAPDIVPNGDYAPPGSAFGFDVYNVVATEVLQEPVDVRIEAMFVGPDSAVCRASALNQRFGFALPADCGSTVLTGGYR